MELQIKNLDAVKEAKIELGDLTVITGENSTGKTCIAYTAWDILNNPQKYFSFKSLKELSKDKKGSLFAFIRELCENRTSTLNLNSIFSNIDYNYSDIFEVDNEKSRESLGYVFSKGINKTLNLKISDIKKIGFKDRYTKELVLEIADVDSEASIGDNKDVKFSFDGALTCKLNIYCDKITQKLKIELTWRQFTLGNFKSDLDIEKEKYHPVIVNHLDTLNIFTYTDKDILLEKVLDALSDVIIPEKPATVIATSERSGVISFITDFVDKRLYDPNEKNYKSLTHTAPVQNNIRLINTLSRNISDRNNEADIKNDISIASNTNLIHIYEEIEKMIGGTLLVEESTGDIKFKKYRKDDDPEIVDFVPYHNLSSSIKSITMIYFQLKYDVNLSSEGIVTTNKTSLFEESIEKDFNTNSIQSKDRYYIIDEPEAFLHPANQTRMARIIAMMVNAGIKVIITTHSDFLIRELNALITLGSIKVKDDDGLKVHNLQENMTLNVSENEKKINIYALHTDGCTYKQTVNEYGILLDTFNQAMVEQNDLYSFVGNMVEKYKRDLD